MTNHTKALIAAKKNKKDEFYTLMEDIEKELKYYKEQFKDKVVFCNCDDFEASNFVKYFIDNFENLELKKLYAMWYSISWKQAQLFEKDKDNNKLTMLNENWDFRSEESIKILKQSDIVVTNPPFSLFREYITQLIKYDKKFLILWNMNAITYKEIFPLIKDNKIWLGVYNWKVNFKQPNINEGLFQFRNIGWFTNLQTPKRKEFMKLSKAYSPEQYQKYDNSKAIEVSKIIDIPYNYNWIMGVPITFLWKYNPEQFEIVGFRKWDDGKDLSINGICPYFRILICRK